MQKLITLLIISLILAYIISRRDRSFSQHSKKQEKLFTFILILILGIFTGLRVWYNDTVTYIQMYEQALPVSEFFHSDDADIASGLGFGYVNSILKTIGANTQTFIMLYGVLTMALYISFIHRHSNSFVFSMFLFFSIGCFVFAQAAIKQSIAMAIGCWAFHYATEHKWIKFSLLVLLAVLFHPYAIIFALIPFMQFKPWNIWGYIWVTIFITAGFLLDRLVGTILSVTTMIGANYDETTFVGEGVNLFRVLVCLVPTFITFIFKNQMFSSQKTKNTTDYLVLNTTMINGLIMFVGLFGTANYFARLANYFLPMQTLAIPWLADRFERRSRILFIILAVLCYCAYFYYQSGILQPFDIGFAQITLLEYIRGLIK